MKGKRYTKDLKEEIFREVKDVLGGNIVDVE